MIWMKEKSDIFYHEEHEGALRFFSFGLIVFADLAPFAVNTLPIGLLLLTSASSNRRAGA